MPEAYDLALVWFWTLDLDPTFRLNIFFSTIDFFSFSVSVGSNTPREAALWRLAVLRLFQSLAVLGRLAYWQAEG